MRFWVFLFALVAISGCKKKTDAFVFDCVVYDDKVDAPVGGAIVTMSVQRAVGGFNPNYETVGYATTDANGRFVIEVEKEVYYSFRLDINHPQHFDQIFDVNPDDVPFSTAYSSTFSLEPKAWLKTHVVNQNGSQTVIFSIDAESEECTNCCTDNNTILQGFPVDSVFKCEVYGEQQVAVTGTYVDNGGAVIQVNEAAFVQAFDTTTINIIY